MKHKNDKMVKMKLDWKKSLGLVFLVTLLLNGCKSPDEVTDCVYYLNQNEYSTVVADTSCSSYERASAYLGLAGFKFSNFLAGDASENFRKALGIPNSATSWDLWAGKTYYDNARQLSGDSTGDVYDGQTRLKEDVEIHYFSTLGALLATTYIELDANADGDVSEAEVQTFTNIRPSDDADYGKNEIGTADWIEFVSSDNNVFLLDITTGLCIPKTVSPKFDGLWTGAPVSMADCGVISAAEVVVAPDGSASIGVAGECNAVVKIDEIQNLFLTSAGSKMSVIDLTGTFVTYVNEIDNDMVDLGIDADSDLRKGLTEFSTNLDNGGDCANDTLTEVDQVFTILAAAAQDTTTDYENANVLSLDEMSYASDTTISVSDLNVVVEMNVGGTTIPVTISFPCDNIGVRMIYKSGPGTYVPDYSSALAAIKNTFTELNNLNTDADGNVKPNVASDGIISFKELLCME